MRSMNPMFQLYSSTKKKGISKNANPLSIHQSQTEFQISPKIPNYFRRRKTNQRTSYPVCQTQKEAKVSFFFSFYLK